jgi:uncharacterized protein (DUF934 family)
LEGGAGERLRSEQSPRLIAEELTCFAVIALEFPKFTDGRPYTGARLLRERYGYTGELRAVGHVLRDQALFLIRCGFDAFEVPEITSADAWRAALARISVSYQAAADGRSPAARLRRHRVRPAQPRSGAAHVEDSPGDQPRAACWAY